MEPGFDTDLLPCPVHFRGEPLAFFPVSLVFHSLGKKVFPNKPTHCGARERSYRNIYQLNHPAKNHIMTFPHRFINFRYELRKIGIYIADAMIRVPEDRPYHDVLSAL